MTIANREIELARAVDVMIAPAKIIYIFFLYFIVFICKLYKGQAKKYYNVSLNNFHKKKKRREYTQKRREKKRERRGGGKEAYYIINRYLNIDYHRGKQN